MVSSFSSPYSSPAPLKLIFLSQCVDHAFGVALSAFLMVSALSLINQEPIQMLTRFAPTFWVGFLGVLFFSSLLCRLVSVSLFGATVGNQLFGLRVSQGYWAGQVLESLELAVPALWAMEWMARSQGSRFSGLRYILART